MMKLRIASPEHIVDLGRIAGLSYLRKEDDALALGATTRIAEIAASQLAASECPILVQCALHIADPLVRNMGTIGGNLSHADPSNDMPAVMVATQSQLVATSSRGRRSIQASDFFVGTFKTALKEGELLTEVRVPLVKGRRGAYMKLERQAGDFGIVGVATVLGLGKDGRCDYCGIGISGAGARVVKASRAEAQLVGRSLDEEAIEKAGEAAASETEPAGDLRGSADYKRAMVKVVTARALKSALSWNDRA